MAGKGKGEGKAELRVSKRKRQVAQGLRKVDKATRQQVISLFFIPHNILKNDPTLCAKKLSRLLYPFNGAIKLQTVHFWVAPSAVWG
jgi:hypothetical protein